MKPFLLTLMCVSLSLGTARAQSGAFETSRPSTTVPTTVWGTSPFTPSAQWDGAGQIQIQMAIAPGQMLYRDQIKVSANAGWVLDPVVWPAGSSRAGGQSVFTSTVTSRVRVRPEQPTGPVTLSVYFQGCTTDGVCHPPEQVTLTLPPPSSKPTLVVLSGTWCAPCQAQDRRLSDPSLQQALQHWQVVKLDVPNDDSAMQTLDRYGVFGVPALRLYAAGEPVSTQGGITLLGEQTMGRLRQALAAPHLP